MDIFDVVIEKVSCGWYVDYEVEWGLMSEWKNWYFYKENNGWWINDEICLFVKFE